MEKRLYFLAELEDAARPLFAEAARAVKDLGIADGQTPGLPPHVTLGTCSPEREGEAMRVLESLEGEKPVPLRFDSMGLFGLRVAFCAPAASRELLALYRRTVLQEEGAWTPHATLLIAEKEEEMLRALPVLARVVKPFAACVDAVSLWEFWSARRLGRVGLGG